MICENIPKSELDILHKSQEFVAEKRDAVAVLVQSVRIVAENHFLRDGISGKEPAGISPAALLQTKKGPRKPASPGALPSYLI